MQLSISIGGGRRAKSYVHSAAPSAIPLPLRKTGLTIDLFITFLSAGSAPWWVQSIPLLNELEWIGQVVSLWIFALGLAVFLILFWLRRRYLKDSALRVGPLFELALFYRHLSQDTESLFDISTNPRSFSLFCNEACSKIADVFNSLTERGDICCSIRLNLDESGVFETIGRSSRASGSRAIYSKPVTVTSRIFGSLVAPNVQVDNVWVIPDIRQGIEDNVISEDENIKWDNRSSGSMLVARLNAYDPGDEESGPTDDFFGILYVVCPSIGVLNEKHVDYMKVVACMTGNAIWQLNILSMGMAPELSKDALGVSE